MGLHDIMNAVRQLSKEEQELLIKQTINIMQENGKTISPALESLLETRWQEHLADPAKSVPARKAIKEMMAKSIAGDL